MATKLVIAHSWVNKGFSDRVLLNLKGLISRFYSIHVVRFNNWERADKQYVWFGF